jgi:hypothetical protein
VAAGLAAAAHEGGFADDAWGTGLGTRDSGLGTRGLVGEGDEGEGASASRGGRVRG